LVAFIVSVDWQVDFTRQLLVGSIFYFTITAICVGVAAWNHVRIVSKAHSKIDIERRIAGLVVSRETIDNLDVESVTLQSVRLLKESEKPRDRMMSRPLRRYMDRRATYYKLYLDTTEKRHLLDDSSDLTDLDTIGQGLADFFSVAYRREEV
jgi:hypothetical protein